MQSETVIIGGGLSGLALADHLHRAGCDFLLIEARDRLGGRIKVLSDGDARFDLGPSWFWQGQPRMTALARRLGLSVFDQYADGALSFEDPQGLVQRGAGMSSMEGSLRIDGGMQALIDGLARGLPEDQIILGNPVDSLTNGTVVTIGLRDGDYIAADRVVLALPPRVAATVAFAPALDPEQVAALQDIPTWMGGQAKFVATYETPFWRTAGLSGDAMSRHGPMVEIHDASAVDGSPAALFGFVGLPAAHRDGNDAALVEACLAQLGRLFGEKALTPRQSALQDWAFAPETATPLDHAALGHHPDYGLPAALANIWQGRVQMGSTEVAPQFGGYLEGALSIAEHLARI